MAADRVSEVDAAAARPLVTFALIAYNQEGFVAQAVHAALAQTYSPLEIILSDDCSNDATFETMCRSASGYAGPHKVVLVRNESNQGIGGHVNRMAALAKGELLVIAAGDDISMPERVEELVTMWIEGQRRAHSLYSSAIVIDASGTACGTIGYPPREVGPIEAIETHMDGVMGCSHAWSREVFDVFGPMLPGTTCDDRVIALRSMLLGGIAYCPKPLIRYRVHRDSLSDHASTAPDQIHLRTVALHRRYLNIAQNYVRDLRLAAADARTSRTEWLREGIAAAERMTARLADKIRFHTESRAVKWRLILKYLVLDPRQAARWLVVVLLPRVYLALQKRNLGLRS